jgi:lipopolysaccharide export system ATP-binding protein
VWRVRKLIEHLLRRQRPGVDGSVPAPDDPYAYRLDEDPSGPESPPWSDAVPMQLPREGAARAPAVTDFSWLEPDLPFQDDPAGWGHPDPGALPAAPPAASAPAQAKPEMSRLKTALLRKFPPRQPASPAQDQPAKPAKEKLAKPERPEKPAKPARPAKRKAASTAPLEGFEGVLAVDGVEKSYRGRKVVRGVSLYVREGEAVGLLGPNGAGKTTVFW